MDILKPAAIPAMAFLSSESANSESVLDDSLDQSSACGVALEESPIPPPLTSVGAAAQSGPRADLDELSASEVYSRFGRRLRLWH